MTLKGIGRNEGLSQVGFWRNNTLDRGDCNCKECAAGTFLACSKCYIESSVPRVAGVAKLDVRKCHKSFPSLVEFVKFILF